MGIKHQFTSPYHLQWNGNPEKLYSSLKTYIKKHIHNKIDWEGTILLIFSFRMLPGIHSKGSPFFLLLDRESLTPLQKLLSLKATYLGDEKFFMAWRILDMLLYWQGKISLSTEKILTNYKIIKEQDEQKNSKLGILCMPKAFPSACELKLKLWIYIVPFKWAMPYQRHFTCNL